MLRLWPPADPGPNRLSDDELADAYGYPEDLSAPFLRVNFVSSADGAATVGGVSEGLSSEPDHRVFGLLRELCEVIVIGAGTARAENYGGARKPSRVTGTPPPIAVVTATAALNPAARLFTHTAVPPLVLTGRVAPEDNRRRLKEAGAEVLVADADRVSPASMLATLERRGLRRVLCEGGPELFAELIAADVVDELCLTVAPILAGGASGRIAAGWPGAPGAPRAMRMASAITEDGVLLLRYRRDR